MAGNSIIKYKGKEIFYFDHRGLKDLELLNNVKKSYQMIKNYNGQELLGIGDFRDVFMTQEVMDYLKTTEVKGIIEEG